MPNLKEYIVVGGLTALGYLTGGKLGSMFGKFLWIIELLTIRTANIIN